MQKHLNTLLNEMFQIDISIINILAPYRPYLKALYLSI